MSGSIADLITKLAAYAAALQQGQGTMLQRYGQQFTGSLKAATPKGREEPHLADSYQATLQGPTQLGITTDQRKFYWVTGGTGIYGRGTRIVPVVKKALWWEGLPRPVASAAGQPPNDFFTPVALRMQSQFYTELPMLLNQITHQFF